MATWPKVLLFFFFTAERFTKVTDSFLPVFSLAHQMAMLPSALPMMCKHLAAEEKPHSFAFPLLLTPTKR